MTNKYLEKIAGTFLEAATIGGAAGAIAAPKGHRGSGVGPGVAGGLGGAIVGSMVGARLRNHRVGAYVGAAAGGAWAGNHSGNKAKKKHDDKVELENYRKMHYNQD